MNFTEDYGLDDNRYSNDFQEDSLTSQGMNIFSVVLYSLIFVLGVPGNAIVIWFTVLKLNRTVNTTWFLNLAVADFICCLSLPFLIASILLKNTWPYGNILCKIIPSIIILNMFSSVFILTLISIDRFLLVTKPVWSQNNRTVRWARLLSGAAWFLAALMCLPIVIHKEEKFSSNSTYCVYNQTPQSKKAMVFTRVIFGFLVPFFIICVSYTLITLKVKNSQFGKSRKTFKVILAVIVAFFICWTPYHIIDILNIQDMSVEMEETIVSLDHFTICLTYFNSCLNPFLYVFMGPEFRSKFKMSLSKLLESAFSEEATGSTSNPKSRKSRDENVAETAQ
ncbi:C3a anaphylatoxin chemotactic receptor-like [Polypterus senegalus]|uniref:C3a anaphylatoxin chemotactic receptor-like n=1 Tax=Polypterus senegalus TaxID=55291 RepID=UPI0019635A26|nr:C3a anaphylatoxin chemotactic receptor-like [Polypterus senegalus]